MSDKLITFRKMLDPAIARDMVDKLNKGGVKAYLQELKDKSYSPIFLVTEEYSPQHIGPDKYYVNIYEDDYARAEKVLTGIAAADIEYVEEDYFLFAFTDEELEEVIRKRDEWGEFNYLLAQKILKEHGHVLPGAELAEMYEERKEELAKTRKAPVDLLMLGYICMFLIGPVGLGVGIYLTSGRTLPDGERVYTFGPAVRKQGYVMMVAGGVMGLPMIIDWICFRRSHNSVPMFPYWWFF